MFVASTTPSLNDSEIQRCLEEVCCIPNCLDHPDAPAFVAGFSCSEQVPSQHPSSAQCISASPELDRCDRE